MSARRAKRFDPRSKGNVSEGREGGRARRYAAPLAHCGSHCCANCITTGSGRDLPSVPRNSVSRGRVPALHNAQPTAQPVTPPSRVHASDVTLRYVHPRKPPPSILDTKNESSILHRVSENSISLRANLSGKITPRHPCAQGVCKGNNSSAWIYMKR